jgi:hypothetical protein
MTLLIATPSMISTDRSRVAESVSALPQEPTASSGEERHFTAERRSL